MQELLDSTPWWAYVLLALLLVAIRDIFFNKAHTIQHNFPIVGHIRYWLEGIGPELRQYIVANNREELPFNRSQRSWVYASSKRENNYQGFGTDQDIHSAGHIFINPAMIPYKAPQDIPIRWIRIFSPVPKSSGPTTIESGPFARAPSSMYQP